MDLANIIYESGLSYTLRTSPFWYPFVLCAHVVFIALTAGGAVLRLFVASGGEHKAIMLLWPVFFGLALAAGLLLFTANPFMYIENPAFLAKLPAIVVAGTLSIAVLAHPRARGRLWARLAVPVFWAGVIVLGRLIAFF